MKVFVLLSTVCMVAYSAKLGNGPQFGAEAAPSAAEGAQIVQDTREAPVGASYKHVIETDDGTYIEEEGRPGEEGETIVVGAYRYTAPDGQVIEVRYRADSTGFHAEGDHLPQPPQLLPPQGMLRDMHGITEMFQDPQQLDFLQPVPQRGAF